MTHPEVKFTARLMVLDEKERIFLSRRKVTAKQRPGQWEPPGGMVDEANETSLEGAVREFSEETGILLDKDLVIPRPLYNVYDYDSHVNKWFSRDYFLYGGRIAADQMVVLTEADSFMHAPLEQALQAVVFVPHQRALSCLDLESVA